ncbi:hypothetical protein [Sporolituus thermophilus]|uniref:hypothetical protein n=1 Tax=Sporolituus thermophilus TaxID=608505 RepID=UPI00115FD2F4|nr:hypothetical protein [Sporolituus thermophilus]
MQKTSRPSRDERLLPRCHPSCHQANFYPLYRAVPVMIRHQPLKGGTPAPAAGSHHPPAL